MAVYRETYTKPLPAEAEFFTRNGERFARWTDRRGRKRTAKVTTGRDGSERIVLECSTHVAKYRDGSGRVRKVGTGCRTKDAAETILSDLRGRAELVRAKVLTPGQDAAADHSCIPIDRHFVAYRDHLTAKGVTETHWKDTCARLARLAVDCRFSMLADVSAEPLDKWLTLRTAEGMSASTRNAYRESLVAFGNWCVATDRLVFNPFCKVPKGDERADRRRTRRALTEDELRRLLFVARHRPLAEFGRPVRKTLSSATVPKRSNWTLGELQFETIVDAADRGRATLEKRPDFIAALERTGRERALVYKALVLTGLRKSELASLTVGHMELESKQPHAVLKAADEKNRQGSSIPIRGDLVEDIRQHLAERLAEAQRVARESSAVIPIRLSPNERLFNVPAGLRRILGRDLVAAGIARLIRDEKTGKTKIDTRDERGRTVDVHALRHTFGTHLSKGGVPLRTAQAAMRHSTPTLTANVYTDPKLLDITGALDALPLLPLLREPQQISAVATGTNDASPVSAISAHSDEIMPMIGDRTLVPTLVPKSGNAGDFATTPDKLIGKRRTASSAVATVQSLVSTGQKASLTRADKGSQNRGDRIRTCGLLVPNQAL